MKQLITKLLRESLLTEIEIFPYKLNTNDKEHISAKFKTDDLSYNVDIWHDNNKHDFGQYEVSFGVDGQKHEGSRQGKDIKHLNNVLYTVMEIVEKVVKEYKVKNIKIDGASDEKDASGMFADTLRGRLYTRFLNNRYPHGAISSFGRHIKVDMTKVFPDIIKDEKGKADMLIALLLKISDEDPDEEGIRRGLNGKDDDHFFIGTDFILSSELGPINVEIDVNKGWGEYTITWDVMDIEDEGSDSFDSFENLYNFIKNKFKVV